MGVIEEILRIRDEASTTLKNVASAATQTDAKLKASQDVVRALGGQYAALAERAGHAAKAFTALSGPSGVMAAGIGTFALCAAATVKMVAVMRDLVVESDEVARKFEGMGRITTEQRKQIEDSAAAWRGLTDTIDDLRITLAAGVAGEFQHIAEAMDGAAEAALGLARAGLKLRDDYIRPVAQMVTVPGLLGMLDTDKPTGRAATGSFIGPFAKMLGEQTKDLAEGFGELVKRGKEAADAAKAFAEKLASNAARVEASLIAFADANLAGIPTHGRVGGGVNQTATASFGAASARARAREGTRNLDAGGDAANTDSASEFIDPLQKTASKVTELASAVSGGLPQILALLGPAGAIAGAIIGVLEHVDELIIGIVKSVDDILASVFVDLAPALAAAVPDIMRAVIVEWPKMVIPFIAALIKAAWDIAIYLAFQLPVEIVKGLLQAFLTVLPGIFKGGGGGGNPLTGPDGKWFGTSFVKGRESLFGVDFSKKGRGFSAGGYVPFTGPALLHQGERVVPPHGIGTQATMQRASGMGGGDTHIHLHGTFASSEHDIVRMLNRALGPRGLNLHLRGT